MTDMTTINIPTGLIPQLIDTVLDRVEKLKELVNDDSFPADLRADYQKIVNDLSAVLAELDDPGSVTWKCQEA